MMINNGGLKSRTRRTFIAGATLLGCMAIGMLFVSNAASQTKNTDTEPSFMFVHSAEDFEADTDAKTLRLVNVNEQVLFFSDRPQRLVGHLKMTDYLKEWTSVEDNFGENPPNAALSVYEPGESSNVMAVVEIMDPVVEGNDIVYGYVLLDGTIPNNGGPTALFIDKIGIGGGVGAGYHGVGVGRRGPGVTGWAGAERRCAAGETC